MLQCLRKIIWRNIIVIRSFITVLVWSSLFTLHVYGQRHHISGNITDQISALKSQTASSSSLRFDTPPANDFDKTVLYSDSNRHSIALNNHAKFTRNILTLSMKHNSQSAHLHGKNKTPYKVFKHRKDRSKHSKVPPNSFYNYKEILTQLESKPKRSLAKSESDINIRSKQLNNNNRILPPLSKLKRGLLRPPSGSGSQDTNSSRKLYIGGLFDLSGSRGADMGRSELTAAKLAIDHVNRQDILPGYQLVLLHNDTGCDPGVGMDALYDLIYRGEQMVMVIGSACSEVTKTLAEIVPYWNLILVSFASTSPALSEREKYTTFFRLAPADSSQNTPRAMFITHFGWDTVATLYEIEEDSSLAVDEMGRTFEQNNITIKISMSFRKYEDIADNLQAIKEQDVRIIIGGFSEKTARNVLCQAYNLHMFGPRYVWILIGDYVERWWELSEDTTCSTRQLQEATEGYFTIDSLNSLSDEDLSDANISLRTFLTDYDTYRGPRPMSPYAPSTYDAVWTVARTLKDFLFRESRDTNVTADEQLQEFTYHGGASTRATFFDLMQNLDFLGISGDVSFEGPDRKGTSVISQNQNGKLARIALYEPDGKMKMLNFYCRTCQPIMWLGGRAPRDKYVIVSRQKKIMPLAFLCVSAVSLAGLILAAMFLAYNLYHRRLRYIKLSSPKLNNVAVVGCMLVYAGIIILGYDDSNLEEDFYPYVCTIRAFLFAAGFSLAFGAMFTKTYRVHQIFTRANRGLIKSKLLRDKQLLIIVGALLVVDSAVLLVWVFVDPMHKQVTNLTVEASENDEDLLFISQLTTCHSEHLEKWTGALYAYKGLLLVFGVYMAWETRSVKIPALNDSQYIGMNVYNVVTMSVIVVTLSNILSHQPTLAFVMESSFMLFSTTTTLCLLFVPKIYAIITSKGDPVIAASGITVDANCRRFAVDEKRELHYRAEVQNRVYKSEIVELDQEILRLETLLRLPVQPYPRVTQEMLYMLPESRVDPSPDFNKRRRAQRKSVYNSIPDINEKPVGVSSVEKSDDATEYIYHQPAAPSRNLRHRGSRLSFRNATSYAVSKFNKLKPRFSMGNVNCKHEYDDLNASTSSPNSVIVSQNYLKKGRLSHPLLRQEAVEERREQMSLLGTKHSSERSETHTFDTHLSDNDTDSDDAQIQHTVTFNLSDKMDYLKVPSSDHIAGCETFHMVTMNQQPKRRRKYGPTLNVPDDYQFTHEQCRITPIDVCHNDGNGSPVLRRARSIIEHERRTRLKKLQTDLMQIQKELKDLDELEYEVSVV